MTFFVKWFKKNLGLYPDPDWILIQQRPGSGSRFESGSETLAFYTFSLVVSRLATPSSEINFWINPQNILWGDVRQDQNLYLGISHGL